MVILSAFVAFLAGSAFIIWQWLRPQLAEPAAAVPIVGSVVLLSDGRTIVYTDPNGLCYSGSLAARQTRTEVVLSLSETAVMGAFACAGFRSLPVSALDPAGAILRPEPGIVPVPPYPLGYRLSSPLDHRRIVDALTGRTIPCFDERTAFTLARDKARWTPAQTAFEVSTSAPYFGGPGAAVLVSYFSGFDALTHRPDGTWLTIVQVSGGGWHPPSWTVTRGVVVRGHDGLAAPGIIVWTEAGRTIAILGQGPARRLAGAAGGSGRGPLPRTQLLAVASALEGSKRP